MHDELIHVGVLGMKWGRRKSKIIKESQDYKRIQQIRKKKVSELSNAELQEYSNRKNLEQNFKRLTPSKIAIGLAAVGGASTLLGNVNKLYSQSGHFIRNGKNMINTIKNVKIPKIR